MPHRLHSNAYGKSDVRLTKVVRNSGVHTLFEFDVDVQLRGDFADAYTAGDNRLVIATDTIKNAVYVLAKERSFDSPEAFARILARHFMDTYEQVAKGVISVRQALWRRIEVGGVPHPHSFTRDGAHVRHARASWWERGMMSIVEEGGVSGLEVIKTTGSEWRDFHDDRYRTLKDTSDRILATSVDATWTFLPGRGDPDHNAVYASALDALLQTFATRHSLGAQHSLKAMGDALLDACPEVQEVRLVLPNQHRIPFNLAPFDLKFENDIFVATSEPFGLIEGVVSRAGPHEQQPPR